MPQTDTSQTAAMDGERAATPADERFKLVTALELEQLTGRRAHRWLTLARGGLVPHVKEGRHVAFRPSDILGWIERGGQGLAHGWRHNVPALSSAPEPPRRGPQRTGGA